MKHKANKDDFINAGAWYRIMKDITTSGCVEVGNSLGLKKAEADALYKSVSKLAEMETRIGFENVAADYYTAAEMCDLFYGACCLPIRSDVDRKVNIRMYNILKNIADGILANLQDDNDISFEERLEKNASERKQILDEEYRSIQNAINGEMAEAIEHLRAIAKESGAK
jgi:hypothetical protein